MSDLISRKDAIELMKNDIENNGLPYDDEYNIGIDHAMCLLACVPTAEPKVGKWIERDDGWENVFYECSECGEAFTLIDGTPTDNLYYYCPFCGAKMERRADEPYIKRDWYAEETRLYRYYNIWRWRSLL